MAAFWWYGPAEAAEAAAGGAGSFTGSGSPTATLVASAAGSGEEQFIGSGTPTEALAASASGSGDVVNPISGSGSPTVALAGTGSGTGIEEFSGSGSPTAPLSTSASGTGVETFSGSGSPTETLGVSASGSGINTPAAITISTAQDVQTVIDANPSATVFELLNDIHRQTATITLRAGLTLRGQSMSAILSGARELHASSDATVGSFVADGATGRYYITGQTQQGTVNTQSCEVGYPECSQPEDLWIDDVLQIPQTNITDVTGPGLWHFDYTNNRIYLWGSPASKQVETSVVQKAISAAVNTVTLNGFVVERYAVPFQSAAIEGDDGGTNWTFTNMEFRGIHGTAVRMGTGWQMWDSHVHDIGQLGLGSKNISGGVKTTGIICDNVEINNCGVSGVTTGFAGGAMKFQNTNGAIFRNGYVHDNPGNGIWYDIDNENGLISNNVVEDNDNQGIFVEISWTTRITGNTVRRCGFGRTNTTGFGAGIFNAASGDIEIDNNYVEDCHNGITGTQQDRGSGTKGGVSTPHIIENFYVHDNLTVLKQTGGDIQRCGLYSPFTPAGPDMFTGRNNRFENNDYDITEAATNAWRWAEGNRTFAVWQGTYGQDVTGSTFSGHTGSGAPIETLGVTASGSGTVVNSYTGSGAVTIDMTSRVTAQGSGTVPKRGKGFRRILYTEEAEVERPARPDEIPVIEADPLPELQPVESEDRTVDPVRAPKVRPPDLLARATQLAEERLARMKAEEEAAWQRSLEQEDEEFVMHVLVALD